MSSVWTITRHPEAGSDRGRDLLHRFVASVAACGEYTTSVAKTRSHVDDPRSRSVSPYQKDLFVHHFRVESPAQLNEEFGRWIADAYDRVGCGSRRARR